MRKLIALLVLCLAALQPLQAATDDTEAAMKAITKAANALKTMSCDFVQTKHLKMLNDQVVSQGQMRYASPDKLRWEYTSPYKYTFVLTGTNVVIAKGGQKEVIDANQSKVFKEIVRIMMNSVVGKNLADKRDFTTTVKSTKTEWIATLQPQRSNLKSMFQRIVLHFNKAQSVITKVELHEKNGDKTVIELKNITTNKPINASTFTVD